MKKLEERLQILKRNVNKNHIKIMIFGLGSVGLYLLDYLISENDDAIEVIAVGRNYDKMESDVNIVKVAATIRHKNKSKVSIVGAVDLEEVASIAKCIDKYKPDFIVNTSRVYAGLKYGSISWKNVRAYGIWAPLAIKYIRNIMEACNQVDTNAIVINSSYSDAVIPWLKNAGKAHPDFGSGNINHLIPRIKFAVAARMHVTDFWNIDVTYATSHFHDVVISKEGQTEGIEQLISVTYQGQEVKTDMNEIFANCRIAMPVDAKRNMMNASSNYDIIMCIISAIRTNSIKKFHSPGAFGEIGGYPIIIDATNPAVRAYIDESRFSLAEMREKNKESIALDGIEGIEETSLIYTNDLLDKIEKAFNVKMVKEVPFENIDIVAEFLIKEIIEKNKD